MGLLNRIKAAAKAFKQEPKQDPVSESKPRTKEEPATPPVSKPKPAVQRALPSYSTKPQVFQDFAAMHRQHQSDAILATVGKKIGQICIPTGTGKSRVQQHLHLEDILSHVDEPGVYVTAAHRLALCRQLMLGLVELAAKMNIPFDIVFVGSDRNDVNAIYEANKLKKKTTYVTTTTNTSEVKKAVGDAHKAGRHALVVTTYHSFDRLAKIGKINMVTYDEAHTIATAKPERGDKSFEAKIDKVKPIIQKEFFFTATRKVSGEDAGMNNKKFYGDVLLDIKPKDMVLAGEIVPPREHLVKTSGKGNFENPTMLIKAIQEAFNMHRKVVKGPSPDLGAKLLVGMEGTPAIQHLIDSKEFLAWCFKNKIKLFAFSSLLGDFMFDKDWKFTKESRAKSVDAMRAMEDEEDAILLHIDILTEGIDLPSITGVMPFRELNLIKLLQMIGRAARLLLVDRMKLYKGEIKPMDWESMKKPYAWVIFPDLDTSNERVQHMRETLKKVYLTDQKVQLEYSLEDDYVGNPQVDLTPITPRDTSTRKDPIADLEHVIEDLMLDNGNPPPIKELTDKLAASADPSLKL